MSWSPTAAPRAMAASSNGSVISTRCWTRDAKDRLKLDVDKTKSWLAKGAQPTDRVLRFLDELDIRKRPARNNPTRAIPRKQRKAMAEEAAKAAAAAKAAKPPAAPAAS